jgi:hypothetical protein
MNGYNEDSTCLIQYDSMHATFQRIATDNEFLMQCRRLKVFGKETWPVTCADRMDAVN